VKVYSLDDLARLRADFTPVERALRDATLVLEGAIAKRTRVKTGNLRRSWNSVFHARQLLSEGSVRTNVSYVRNQRNNPGAEGYTDASVRIRRLLEDALHYVLEPK
jgi:hypothetical protein